MSIVDVWRERQDMLEVASDLALTLDVLDALIDETPFTAEFLGTLRSARDIVDDRLSLVLHGLEEFDKQIAADKARKEQGL